MKTSEQEISSGHESIGVGTQLGRYRLVERIGQGGIAVLHASLGDVDEAFRWLEVAIEERASGFILLRVHPRLDPIRKDPRYNLLVRRLGLDNAPV